VILEGMPTLLAATRISDFGLPSVSGLRPSDFPPASPVMGTKLTGSTARCSSLPLRFCSSTRFWFQPVKRDNDAAAVFGAGQKRCGTRLRAPQGHDDANRTARFGPNPGKPVAGADVATLVQPSRFRSVAALWARSLMNLNRIDLATQPGEHGGLVTGGRCRFPARGSVGFGSSRSGHEGDDVGLEMVCPWPMGRGWSV